MSALVSPRGLVVHGGFKRLVGLRWRTQKEFYHTFHAVLVGRDELHA